MGTFLALRGFADVTDEIRTPWWGEQGSHVEVGWAFGNAFALVGLDEGLESSLHRLWVESSAFVIAFFPVLGHGMRLVVVPSEDVFEGLFKSLMADETWLDVKGFAANQDNPVRTIATAQVTVKIDAMPTNGRRAQKRNIAVSNELVGPCETLFNFRVREGFVEEIIELSFGEFGRVVVSGGHASRRKRLRGVAAR